MTITEIIERLSAAGMKGYGLGHSARVAAALPPALRDAGALHDAVEDGFLTLDEVRADYGDRTAAAVDAVTRRGSETYEEFIERVAGSGDDAVAVKVADLTDNLRGVADGEHPKGPERAAFLAERYRAALARLSG